LQRNRLANGIALEMFTRDHCSDIFCLPLQLFNQTFSLITVVRVFSLITIVTILVYTLRSIDVRGDNRLKI